MSNNKWIPQWKKDKEAAEIAKQKLEKDALKGMEFTETNFPELPKNPAHISRKVFWEKSFVNLATDWKTESEKRSKEEDIQSEFKRSQASIDNTIIFPQFANNHTFVEEEEEEEEDKKTKDSDWTLVSRQKIVVRRRSKKLLTDQLHQTMMKMVHGKINLQNMKHVGIYVLKLQKVFQIN